MEPLKVLEIDAGGGEVQIRSQRPTARAEQRGFYEVRLFKQGPLRMERFVFDEATRQRQRDPCQLTREVLERLADDIVGEHGLILGLSIHRQSEPPISRRGFDRGSRPAFARCDWYRASIRDLEHAIRSRHAARLATGASSIFVLAAAMALAALRPASAAGVGPPGVAPDADAQRQARWFEDAKFGLFVHWGVYSLLGKGEWVMKNDKIPIAEYEKLPPRFNPVEVRRRRVGQAREGGRDEVHHHHEQAPRRLLHVRQQADRTTTSSTPPRMARTR